MCHRFLFSFCFIGPCDTGGHASFGGLSPFLENGFRYARLIMAEDSPHLTMQRIIKFDTYECSHGVVAGVDAL